MYFWQLGEAIVLLLAMPVGGHSSDCFRQGPCCRT